MIGLMLIAGLGGFAGTCCRYLAGVGAKKAFGSGFPAGTMIANTVGCFIFGVAVGLWAAEAIGETMRVALLTGFCGGLTTFSSFGHDAYSMMGRRKWLKCACYLTLTVGLGMAAMWLGMKVV